VDKALLTIPELMRSPPGFSGTLLAQFLLCLSFCLFYFGHCIHCKSALRYTASDYPLAIVSIVGLPFDIQILITLWPLYVCPSIYSFWLPFVHCMSALRYTASDYPLASLKCCEWLFVLYSSDVSWNMTSRTLYINITQDHVFNWKEQVILFCIFLRT
jgi:hypothetical protein